MGKKYKKWAVKNKCNGITAKETPCPRNVETGPIRDALMRALRLRHYCENHEPPWRKWARAGITALGIASTFVGFLAGLKALGLLPKPTRPMDGSFRIAFAEFSTESAAEKLRIGPKMARSTYLHLKQVFEDADIGFHARVIGPEHVGPIKGKSPSERAQSAEELAERFDADIVIWGRIEAKGTTLHISPEFYVSSHHFADAREITGLHDLGAPVSLYDDGGVGDRVRISKEFECRARVLSGIILGLCYYSADEYDRALSQFQATERIANWRDELGKRVLYLLIGDTAGKAGNLELAEEYHLKSLAIDPQYPRAKIGLASTYYLFALKTYATTHDKADIDPAYLDLAIAMYKAAADAHHNSPSANIPAKAHFGLGQSYLMQSYYGSGGSLAAAKENFMAVIEEYNHGSNAQLRELAGESHSRLGWIYEYSGVKREAANEYRIAASLVKNPTRQTIYQQRVVTLHDNSIRDHYDKRATQGIGDEIAVSRAGSSNSNRTSSNPTAEAISGFGPNADSNYKSGDPEYFPYGAPLPAQQPFPEDGAPLPAQQPFPEDILPIISIFYTPGASMQTQAFMQQDTGLDDPNGVQILEGATRPCLYIEQDGSLLLYNFDPNERVRVFVYEQVSEDTAELKNWYVFQVSSDGHLSARIDYMGDITIAVGDVSGEIYSDDYFRPAGPKNASGSILIDMK